MNVDYIYDALMRERDAIIRRSFITSGRMIIDGFQVLIRDYYNETEPIRFEVTSVAVIMIIKINGQDYSLLLQQRDRQDFPWEYPSGKVEIQDITPEDTAVRELHEETGLQFKVEDLICLSYKRKNATKGALQYFIELNGFPEDWKVLFIDEVGRIFIETPEAVDQKEIRMMCLEPLRLINTVNSLGITSNHKWANSVWGALANKGYDYLFDS